jgi:hypothetical protein
LLLQLHLPTLLLCGQLSQAFLESLLPWLARQAVNR